MSETGPDEEGKEGGGEVGQHKSNKFAGWFFFPFFEVNKKALSCNAWSQESVSPTRPGRPPRSLTSGSSGTDCAERPA